MNLRKYLKKLTVFTTSLLIVVSNIQLPIKAAEKTLHYGSGTGISYSASGPALEGSLTTDWNADYPFLYLDKPSDIVFCVDPSTLAINGGTGYSKGDFNFALRDKMNLIAFHGYYSHNKTAKWYMASQFMIWETRGWKINSTNLSDYASMKKQIQNDIDHHYDIPSFDGNHYTLNVGESITLTDTKGVLSEFDIDSISGVKISKNGNKVTITPSKDAPNSFKFTGERYRGESSEATIVYKTRGNTSQTVSTLNASDPVKFSVDIKVNKYGALKITKQDEDGNLVPNTSFKVSKNADMSSPIGTYKTGSDGTVTVNDLAPSTYYVKESAVPNHLILDKTIHKVSVAANKTASFTARNKWKKGRVQIRKVDTDSKKQVAGATYAIFNQQGQELQRLVTKASGYSMSGYLRVGQYYVQEVIAPKGYTLNKTKYPVTISNHDQTITVTGTDKRQSGTLKLSKADSETNKKPQGDATLQGAVYELRAKENILDPADQSVKYKKGALVATLTTDKNGNATKTGLYLGKYTLKETKASPGYRLDPKSYDVTINPAAQTTSVITVSKNVLEDIIKLRIHKVQEEPKLNIPNTIFTFTKPNGTTSEVKTDKNGSIQFVGLRPGVYILKEKAVMDGYDINPTEVRFEVVSGGGVKVLTDLTNTGITFQKTNAFDGIITVRDKVSPFTLKITKLNDHKQLLDGAEFTLYSDKAYTKVVAKRTSYNGVLSFAGLKDRTKYYLKETKAPDGYRIPLDPDTKQPHIYEIETVSSPVNDLFELWVDGKKYTPKDTVTTGAIRIEGTKKARVVHMEIVNMVGIKLPETGSDLMFPMFIIGMGLMFLGRKSLRGGVRE